MTTKIQIKSILGKVLFEFEAEDNSLKKTLEEAVRLKANLRGADLQKANLWGANLWGADLQGADLWGAYLWGAYLQKANLRGADLQGANLQKAYLWGADLQEADLRGAYLQKANLQKANLRGANLQEADLQGANLWGADLQKANLQKANLRGAYLQKANLRRAKGLKLYWHIHHEELVENLTESLKNRIDYIKEEKPKEEVELRLKLLKKVKAKQKDWPITKVGWEKLHSRECGCGWDGKTIFAGKNMLKNKL